MKSYSKKSPAVAAINAWCLSHVAVLAKAFHYGRAAERDERNGFPYTAAMEWRKAAELFAPNTRPAQYFWRQWERIMQLPRRLAGPVGGSQQPYLVLPAASASRSAIAPTIDQISFANAA
jgi:hypothetical protein